jgi:ABC-type lipoprotein export system ATPase subunit
MDILAGHWKEGRTIVMVTHNDHVASYSRRTILLFDGMVQP